MRPAPDEHRQQELLTSGPDERMKTLDRVMDRVNARQGRGRQQWMSGCPPGTPPNGRTS